MKKIITFFPQCTAGVDGRLLLAAQHHLHCLGDPPQQHSGDPRRKDHHQGDPRDPCNKRKVTIRTSHAQVEEFGLSLWDSLYSNILTF